MKYCFDNFGILTSEVLEGRDTEIAPPDTPLPQGFVWRWEGYSWEIFDPTPKQPEAIQSSKKITRLAFLNRFTDAEAIALDLSSIGTTVEAASIRRYLSKVNAAEFIDLENQDTRNGVIALEAMGLIDPTRSLAILDAPVLDSEKAR